MRDKTEPEKFAMLTVATVMGARARHVGNDPAKAAHDFELLYAGRRAPVQGEVVEHYTVENADPAELSALERSRAQELARRAGSSTERQVAFPVNGWVSESIWVQGYQPNTDLREMLRSSAVARHVVRMGQPTKKPVERHLVLLPRFISSLPSMWVLIGDEELPAVQLDIDDPFLRRISHVWVIPPYGERLLRVHDGLIEALARPTQATQRVDEFDDPR